jgi:hypothetical protein
MGFARITGLFATVATLLALSSAASAALESHRAAYRLTLDQAKGVNGLSGVDGGLVIEWKRACDGWLSHQRLGFIASTDAGARFSHDVRFSSWEATDGLQMRYTVRSYDGDRLKEEYMGEASLDAKDSGGVATFTKPDQRDVSLPAGTVFPADHFNRILEEASGGNSFVSHEVFDGWGFDALTQVTSVIGQPRPYEPSSEREIAAEAEAEVWPVSMAYYNITDGSDLPEFEATFMLTKSGVLQELLLDYGDFRLKATLSEFELLDEPAC